MARRNRRGRPINGILVCDKPSGMSSNKALQIAKHLYFANKAGHTGSLDPLATGVLPICFGEATKFSQFLLEADKRYDATVVLGASSNTEDADGDISAVADAGHLLERDILALLPTMLGEQMQVPPMYSALKHNGQRLYDIARKGGEVERKPRAIKVHELALTGFRSEGAQAKTIEIDLTMLVSKGTYVRSIAADIGRHFKVGGYLAKLRRTQVSTFGEQQLVSLEQLQQLKDAEDYAAMDALLVPTEVALQHLPTVRLDDTSGFYLRRGNPVQVPKAPSSGVVKLITDAGEFVGVGEIDDNGNVAPKRLVVT